MLNKIAVSIITIAAASFAQTNSGYHMTGKISIGGEGGWDYISFDAQSHRLFASHGNHVSVISTDSDKVIGDIPKTEGVHGIAVADELGRCFISNGRTSTVSIVDLKTLQLTDTIAVGKNPDAILYDPFSKRVFVCNGRSSDVSILDAATGKVVSTLPLNGKPEFSATDGKGKVFVNIEDKSEITAIDAKEMKVLATWPIKPGEEPSGLAIDAEHERLFAVCGNKLMVVVDGENGTVLASLPIGERVDGCAFDPGTGLAFSSNGEGTVTVVREETPSKYSVLETVKTQAGARTITVDPTTHTLYLPTAEFGPAPEPTAEHPHPRPTIVPNTFVILKVQK
ncbi:MAG TPA: cytochrome D1 domain-containing protein [Bacteroidota bacterium]|nr:cytochrome D1 domain-containing protein [Bacteroidota bacterium]